jgi:alkylation response protein AidB-like acyl-CoA dehydrogenase
MHSSIEDVWVLANAGGRIAREQKAALRLAATHAAWQSAAAVDLLYHAGGGSSVYESNLLQRCFRDVHVATQHIMVAQPTYEMLGKMSLGLDDGRLL